MSPEFYMALEQPEAVYAEMSMRATTVIKSICKKIISRVQGLILLMTS